MYPRAVLPEEQRRIGSRIAQVRKGAGLTQRELAAELGVTPRSVQNYESGAVVPYKHLRRIELLTRTRPGWIMGESDQPDLFVSVDAVHEALQRHQVLMAEHLEAMKQHTERLREQREATRRRRDQDRDRGR